MNTQRIRRALVLVFCLLFMLSGASAQASWLFGGYEIQDNNNAVVSESDEPVIEGDDSDLAQSNKTESTKPIAGSAVVLDDTITVQVAPQVQAETHAQTGSMPQKLSTKESSVIRVKLSSLDAPSALGITFAGPFTVDGDKGFRIAKDTEAVVAVDGENLLLTVGGLTIDMGISVNFRRHATDDGMKNGVYIHENKYNTLYVGDLTLMCEDGAIVPIINIDVDEYLYGVVPFEMSDSFPLEALKAQAVAARTYALSRRAANAKRAYDVVDTTADQVYRGLDYSYENAIRAVNETQYVAGRYKDDYAVCYFSASNGGQTAMPGEIWGYAGDYGYLDVRDDPYDLENEKSIVKRVETDATGQWINSSILSRLKSKIEGLGYGGANIERIVSMVPAEPKFGNGNRMYTKLRCELQVANVAPNPVVDLDFYGDLKPNLGLKINSANCEMLSVVANYPEGSNELPSSFVIESRRFGHGVGLSQRGAQQMAGQHGMDWVQILEFYYPGMQLTKMDFDMVELTEIEALPASVGYARVKPTPKPTPAPLPQLGSGEYYAKTVLASRASTLNVREQPNTEARILDVLTNGQRVVVMKEVGDGWAEIKTAELRGFVRMEYLVRE